MKKTVSLGQAVVAQLRRLCCRRGCRRRWWSSSGSRERACWRSRLDRLRGNLRPAATVIPRWLAAARLPDYDHEFGQQTTTQAERGMVTGMTTTTARRLVTIAVVAAISTFALGAGAASARTTPSSCGKVTAGGHRWGLIAIGVSCSTAKGILGRYAGQTAALRVGQIVRVSNPPAGYAVCSMANRGKGSKGGSCGAPGAKKLIVWVATA